MSELEFESQALGKGVARMHALEALIVVGFLRGLAVRDVEALLEQVFSEQVVSKPTVARICQDTRERLPRVVCATARRARSRLPVLGRDLSQAAPRRGAAEGVLVAWGLTLEGHKVLLGLALGKPREL